MCSIVGSSSIDKVRELAKLNEYRGTHSHSLFVIDRLFGNIMYNTRGFGPLVVDDHLEHIREDDVYIIAHQQAPTTENKTADFIHPAQTGDHELLWHNGIVKANEVKRLQEELQCGSTWDTFLILRHLLDYNTPDNIDGTFSCVWYHQGEIFIFRNEISPMFVDDELNISSTKFENSTPLPPNIMFNMGIYGEKLNKDCLVESYRFTTKENPYYFGV